jgi:hypothetical protein
MAENDDVQLVESISGIDGMSPTLDVQSVHMHGYVGASSIVIALDLVDIATNSNYVVASNYVAFASNSTKVEIQQLVAIQAQAIAWKSHS